jgi:hypothetical protein
VMLNGPEYCFSTTSAGTPVFAAVGQSLFVGTGSGVGTGVGSGTGAGSGAGSGAGAGAGSGSGAGAGVGVGSGVGSGSGFLLLRHELFPFSFWDAYAARTSSANERSAADDVVVDCSDLATPSIAVGT